MLGAPVSKRGASRMVSDPARRGLAQKPPLLPLLTREFTTWRASDPALQEPTESRSPSGQQVGNLHSHLCSLVLANCPKDVGYYYFFFLLGWNTLFLFTFTLIKNSSKVLIKCSHMEGGFIEGTPHFCVSPSLSHTTSDTFGHLMGM